MRRLLSLLVSLSPILLIILCLAAIVLGWFAWRLPEQAETTFGPSAPSLGLIQRVYLSAQLTLLSDNLTKANEPNGTDRSFSIQLGESTLSITNRLEQEGFISSSQALRTYLVYSGLDTTLQTGDYHLSPAMTPLEIAQKFRNASSTDVKFRILAGWRIEEIAAALPTSGLDITPEAFQQAAYHPYLPPDLTINLPDGASLEGFLYPDLYQFPRSIGVNDFLKGLVVRFSEQNNEELSQGFEKQGLSVFEAVTLASIIQREAIVEEEMPMIASVFYNRLATGMKLDSDPTVQYALGYIPERKGWWKNPLSLEDLQVNSPYNTYLNKGLPPGPISNPSLNAIMAVAFPAQTPYFYFRAACDGSGLHLFSKTFQEHLNKGCP